MNFGSVAVYLCISYGEWCHYPNVLGTAVKMNVRNGKMLSTKLLKKVPTQL